jgi:hypothetical protein
VKKIIASVSAAFILSASALINPVFAEGKNTIEKKGLTQAQQLIQSSGSRATREIKAHELQKIIKEAVDVVAGTNKVLYLLAHNQTEKAKKELKALKEKLNNLDKKYKGKLTRLPVDVVITEIRGVEDIKLASQLAKQAKKAVNNNDFVTGRFILNTLRDEIEIDTAYLPIALYKEAIDLAYKFLEEGKVKSAMNQLQIALGTIEIETTIIPRPLAIASLLVEDASKIYKKDPKTALALLDEAKRQIKLSKVLGYVRSDKEIEPLIKQIDELKTAIVKNLKGSKEKFGKLIKNIKETKEKETKTNNR